MFSKLIFGNFRVSNLEVRARKCLFLKGSGSMTGVWIPAGSLTSCVTSGKSVHKPVFSTINWVFS